MEPEKVEVNENKLFGKWPYSELQVKDLCFKDYIAVSQKKSKVLIPHTSGRYQVKQFRKAQCPIVERLVGALMFHGRNGGKKMKAIRIVKHAFEIINLMTGQNPIQVFINAVMKAGAREDSTRVGAGGVVKKSAVDVSPLRRLNQSLYFMTQGARNKSMRNVQTIAECLADEIMNTAKDGGQSFCLRKKDEIEKIAKTSR